MTAKPLMIQGTMSNVGKSIIAAGLCRIFHQDGFRVAPFKSQNMSLNSFVTPDGCEIGRAQALQACASGLEPCAAMNPILLKPESEVGSQVIVNGHAERTMSAKEYFAYKHTLVPTILCAYDTLAATADIVVIEGAGSPAEINLAAGDIVNMGLADMCNAPVLLVGDIDPGGVFAQLIGTLDLLPEAHRRRVCGFIINKFRGDADILTDGLVSLEQRAHVPVIGVVPYLSLDLDDEDSLSSRLLAKGARVRGRDGTNAGAEHGGLLDIAAIRFPHLSNFTDLDAFARQGACAVRWVEHAVELGHPDMVVLPGTKATRADCAWLMTSGLGSCICALASEKTPLVGICGGYQMLGEIIADSHGVEGGTLVERTSGACAEKGSGACAGEESDVRAEKGSGACAGGGSTGAEGNNSMLAEGDSSTGALGLLPLSTTLHPEKHLTQIESRIDIREGFFSCLSGMWAKGYEIHAGQTQVREDGICRAAFEASATLGIVRRNVLGTYMHGFFDASGIVDALVGALFERRGLSKELVSAHCAATLDADAHRERELNRLADALRDALDMQAIYRIVEAGV